MNHAVTRSPAIRMLGICAILGAALALSGCDDGSSTVGSSENVSHSEAEARARADVGAEVSEAANSSDSETGKSSTNAVSANDFCSLLNKETTKVAGLSTLETRRIVRKDISNLYESEDAVAESNAARMDKMTKSCSYEASRVMAQSRILSFKQLFYGL